MAVAVLVFAIYPFTKDFLFEYPNHTGEAGLAYGLAILIALVLFAAAYFGFKYNK